jgi:hypothetical protein
MKFYSGFSLKNESHFFKDFIKESQYNVSGFSYGAIKAFSYVKEQLDASKRVDTLQLFSPAFFQTKGDRFKKLQLLAHDKNQKEYVREFLNACFYPYSTKVVECKETTSNELDELLNYQWQMQELKDISKKGVKIEVYLGGEDKIIDVKGAREFFLKVATLTYIKDGNHFLQID